MKILVAMKQVCDPYNAHKTLISADGKSVETGVREWIINPLDLYAIETAMRPNEGPRAKQLGETIVVSLGPELGLRRKMLEAFVSGADRGILIDAREEDLDSAVVARAVKSVVEEEQPDLVLLGAQSLDGDSAAVGPMLAEMLGWPMATCAAKLAIDKAGKVLTVGREVDDGMITLRLRTPAVVTVGLGTISRGAVKNGTAGDHLRHDDVRERLSWGQARARPLATRALASLGIDTNLTTTYTKLALAAPRPGVCTFVEDVDDLIAKLQADGVIDRAPRTG